MLKTALLGSMLTTEEMVTALEAQEVAARGKEATKAAALQLKKDAAIAGRKQKKEEVAAATAAAKKRKREEAPRATVGQKANGQKRVVTTV
jgi:hypothetical protein